MREINDIKYHIAHIEDEANKAESAYNAMVAERDYLFNQVNNLEELVSNQAEMISSLNEETQQLKLELISALKLIDDSQKEQLQSMKRSVDSENHTVADEIINSIYNK